MPPDRRDRPVGRYNLLAADRAASATWGVSAGRPSASWHFRGFTLAANRSRSRPAASQMRSSITCILEPSVIDRILTHLGLDPRGNPGIATNAAPCQRHRTSRIGTTYRSKHQVQALRADLNPPRAGPVHSPGPCWGRLKLLAQPSAATEMTGRSILAC